MPAQPASQNFQAALISSNAAWESASASTLPCDCGSAEYAELLPYFQGISAKPDPALTCPAVTMRAKISPRVIVNLTSCS